MTTTNKITNMVMLINSIDRAVYENLKVFRSGGVGAEGSFTVVNHENVDAYQVQVIDGIIQGCNCPHAFHRKTICKHQIKVSMIHELNIAQLKQD